jgi:hypothetical protein
MPEPGVSGHLDRIRLRLSQDVNDGLMAIQTHSRLWHRINPSDSRDDAIREAVRRINVAVREVSAELDALAAQLRQG